MPCFPAICRRQLLGGSALPPEKPGAAAPPPPLEFFRSWLARLSPAWAIPGCWPLRQHPRESFAFLGGSGRLTWCCFALGVFLPSRASLGECEKPRAPKPHLTLKTSLWVDCAPPGGPPKKFFARHAPSILGHQAADGGNESSHWPIRKPFLSSTPVFLSCSPPLVEWGSQMRESRPLFLQVPNFWTEKLSETKPPEWPSYPKKNSTHVQKSKQTFWKQTEQFSIFFQFSKQ